MRKCVIRVTPIAETSSAMSSHSPSTPASAQAVAGLPPYMSWRIPSTAYDIGSTWCRAANGPGNVCQGKVPPAVTSWSTISTRPRNCPTLPSQTFSARMMAANVRDANAMRPYIPTGFSMRKPRAPATIANSPTIWMAPSSPGVSQPARVILTGECSAVIARRETGFTIRNSA